MTFLEEFDNRYSIAGLGSMTLEIVEQVPDLDAIIIPTGK